MSMMGMLGKVAMGILVAKGVGKIMGGNTSRSGGLLDGLGGLLGGGASDSGVNGGLGGLLGSLAGSQQTAQYKDESKDFASMFNDAIQGKDPEPTAEHNEQAEILLNAMVSAAKADGSIDAGEQKKILEQLNDVSEEEADLVRKAVQAPLDLQGLIDSVPSGMEQQVYLISLLAINLDSTAEAAYLDKLAQGLKLSNEISNQIHDKLGAPRLY
ncbi:MAG TPA: DUF533 domain-containing protein [Leucothrix mucor]|uniref:DUF533 domain-containing protein n=1 Tax=Leucothrix mucor TaxID=45248 RepID=A0A7V2T1R7_LEUMU|nr:DUF533 domain-containing protein [Leucothrix mucor]